MLLWGPGLDAELEFRRERIAGMWGRPAWADRVAGASAGVLARRRAARGVGSAGAGNGVGAGAGAPAGAVPVRRSRRGGAAVGSTEPGPVAFR